VGSGVLVRWLSADDDARGDGEESKGWEGIGEYVQDEIVPRSSSLHAMQDSQCLC